MGRARASACATTSTKNGFARVLLGLSGGIDSALVAALAADALGADRVDTISMPTRFNVAETRSDARRVAESLGVGFREQPIEDLAAAFIADGARRHRPRGGEPAGTHPRRAADDGLEPARTPGADDLEQVRDGRRVLDPVRRLGGRLRADQGRAEDDGLPAAPRWLNEQAGRERIPASIIDRPPSAELRDDQRDDQSLPPYAVLDPILEAYVERDLAPDEIVALGLGDADVVRRIARLVDLAEYKRRQAPPGLKLQPKAFGRDRRMPITNALPLISRRTSGRAGRRSAR